MNTGYLQNIEQQFGSDVDQSDLRLDRQLLQAWNAPGARWLWILKHSGLTNLVRLGVHEKESSWGRAALSNEREVREVRLLEKNQEKTVSVEKARLLLDQFDYDVRGGAVYFKGSKIATVNVSNKHYPTARENYYSADVVFSSVGPLEPHHVGALRCIGTCLAVQEMGTLFTRARISVDGVQLDWKGGLKDFEAQRRKLADEQSAVEYESMDAERPSA